jgi:hypothetical protein
MTLRREVPDECGVLAAFAHAVGEVVHDVGAIGSVVECLDINVCVLLVARFVSNDDYPSIHGLLEHSFERLG